MERDHLKATNDNFITERILKEQSLISTKIIENPEEDSKLSKYNIADLLNSKSNI